MAIAAAAIATVGTVGTVGTASGLGVGGGAQPLVQAPQTITFRPLDNKYYGGPTLHMTATTTATANPGGPTLPITYTSLTPSTCTVAGPAVTIVRVGQCTIQAAQPGNSAWAPATPVRESFVIGYRITKTAPNPGAKFLPGSKVPVSFRLVGWGWQPLPIALAQSLGCTVTATFGSSPATCATYNAATRFFQAAVTTPKHLGMGHTYPIAVKVTAGRPRWRPPPSRSRRARRAAAGTRSGYWMLGAGGNVYAFGDAANLGGAKTPAVAMAERSDGSGYWIVDDAGTVSALRHRDGARRQPRARSR